MPEPQLNVPYPVIDTDPTFGVVCRSFRPSDYACWALSAAGFPAALVFLERINPSPPMPRGITPALRVAGVLGAIGGFLLAYQRTSLRYWGWTENEREAALYRQHMQRRISQGEAPHDESVLSEHMQNIAASNSQYAALKFDAIPWFNFVNHKYHGPNQPTTEQIPLSESSTHTE
ncbi:NADH-ubiquinone oxidoreductase complex I, 21 kDa subunit-domain-containing protein [Syncephalis plumigaleata]|nr:NADH-ubiquinone oxidoreductase complex I, 21 kDa subunit-domain-containing protein [Syncephalis plumigaleata]